MADMHVHVHITIGQILYNRVAISQMKIFRKPISQRRSEQLGAISWFLQPEQSVLTYKNVNKLRKLSDDVIFWRLHHKHLTTLKTQTNEEWVS